METNTTFGEIFFEKIDENEYLKKLYEDIPLFLSVSRRIIGS